MPVAHTNRGALIIVDRHGDLMDRVVTILDQARNNVVRAVNSNMVIAYWLIGREIVQGAARRRRAGRLRPPLACRTVRGAAAALWKRTLRNQPEGTFVLFFQAYANRSPEIRHKPCDELGEADLAGVLADLSAALKATEALKGFSPNPSWSHYRSLSMLERPAGRCFYEIEAERCQLESAGTGTTDS
jgi:hypothetical protein